MMSYSNRLICSNPRANFWDNISARFLLSSRGILVSTGAIKPKKSFLRRLLSGNRILPVQSCCFWI
uniref:Uncharacterized protein n=1 Tax=Zymomonas mobilis subsp. mobilis str. CP4 = NRRL B-14023 TaxID=627343 RepID=B3GN74_ZYMMB|nr:hypothetical protein [Zymomonas mobilis subsp. mobilis str. CP4 = NRRL B-14023]